MMSYGNNELMIENLKMKAPKYYQNEVNLMLEGRLFVEEDELEEIHEKVSNNTIKKFRHEFKMLERDDKYLETMNECLKIAYENIIRKNEMCRPKAKQAIGIDLGTTNSCVAYFNPSAQNKFDWVIVPNEFNKKTTASVVSIRDNEEVVGDEAKEHTYVFPKNTIMSVKRLIGRKFNDESVQKSLKLWSYDVFDDGNNNPKIRVKVNEEEKHYYPEQISAKVLKKMKDMAKKHLGCDVTKAVITVPAYFNDSQKQATKDAAKIAGLEVLRIINEPTAAAIAYRFNWTIDFNEKNVLIYDFGGGTFDVAVLKISKGEIDVKAVGGDNHLGGDDFDTNVINYCLDDFEQKYQKTLAGDEGEKALCRLRVEVEKAKIKLSSVKTVQISLLEFYDKLDMKVELTRAKFEELTEQIMINSIILVEKTLREANLTENDIDDIVLVGGTTLIPKVQELLSLLFVGRPLNHPVNPDEAVAVGAAFHAAMLNAEESFSLPFGELNLSDVAPISLGIEIFGKKYSKIITKNTKVPTIISKNYFTVYDNQTKVAIKIYEGEDKSLVNNNLLGEFILTNVPPGKPGEQPIIVTFELTDEGILNVIAKVESTGNEKSVKIVEHKGRMTAEILEALIKEVILYNLNSFSIILFFQGSLIHLDEDGANIIQNILR